MKNGKLNIIPIDDSGVTMVELLIVMAVIAVMSAVSLFYLTGHQKLYKPDEQLLRIADVLQEARQRAMTQRETIRVEIDKTANIVRLFDENTATSGNADDKEVRRLTLLSTSDVRMDQAPTNITYNPPESVPVPIAVYKQSTYPASNGNQVCTLRFYSNGNVGDADSSPNVAGPGATLYVWSPSSNNSTTSSIARAITITGATGAIRLWEFDPNSSNTNKWKDSRRTGAIGG